MKDKRQKLDEVTQAIAAKMVEVISDESDEQIEGINELSGVDLFTSMLHAHYIVYRAMLEEDAEDLIGFTHLMNRLAVIYTMNQASEMKDDSDADTPGLMQ